MIPSPLAAVGDLHTTLRGAKSKLGPHGPAAGWLTSLTQLTHPPMVGRGVACHYQWEQGRADATYVSYCLTVDVLCSLRVVALRRVFARRLRLRLLG